MRERLSGFVLDLPIRAQVVALCAFAVLVATYVVLRYEGYWGETDTSVFAAATRARIETGELIPSPGYVVYPNGYGYQVLGAFLVRVSGLDLTTLQLYGSALLLVWIVLPAWLAYRAFTGTPYGASLATALLLVQPEFLFAVLRGTHEKFSRGLMLVCLYLLVRSVGARHRPTRFTGMVLAFCLAFYALLAFNNFLALSLVGAMALACLLVWSAARVGLALPRGTVFTLRRLAYGVAFAAVVAFLFTFYAYTPAQHGVRLLRSVGEQLTLLVGFEHPTAPSSEGVVYNPYAVVTTWWVSLPVYLVVSLGNWLTLVPSLALWMYQSSRWLRGAGKPERESDLLLWALYGAFALQGAFSAVVDLSGALSGNLQHRSFSSFVMLAAPVVAKGVVDGVPRRLFASPRAHVAVWTLVAALAVLSLLKATNEPLLSNKWLFHLPGEMWAVRWTERTLPGRAVWIGFDERLESAREIQTGGTLRQVLFDKAALDGNTRDLLVSEVTRRQSQRLGVPLPLEGDDLVTYDNGEAQIVHRRPKTPYQP